MSICSKLKALLPMIATVAILLVVATSAFGQCAMCRASLAGSNNALFIKNFNIGVLVLLVPPVTIFCSIFVALKRYRASDENNGNADEDDANK
jgi:sulfopyruvate decarboxylase TPP-binding subunit